MMGSVGPNWTHVTSGVPTAPGWVVILLQCMKCQAALGAYSYPAAKR